MSKFAETTTVQAERTLAEIKELLLKYGATRFGYIEGDNQIAIAFEVNGRRIRFTLPLPDPEAKEFWQKRVNQYQQEKLAPAEARKRWQQTVNQRYRALLNVIKFKLVAIEEGVATFEDEFLAYTLLPDGSTVGDWAEQQLEQTYLAGRMPPLLPGS